MSEVKQGGGKYRAITLAVGIFLVLISIVLVTNYRLSVKESRLNMQINAIGELSDYTYDVGLNIHRLRNAQLHQKPLDESIKSVNSPTNKSIKCSI